MSKGRQIGIGKVLKKRSGRTYSTVREINPRLLKVSPENAKIYKPVSPQDPSIVELAEDIRQNGVLETLVVTEDFYVLSGHRRREAAILAELKTVPCKVRRVRHSDKNFLKLLTSYNVYRHKSSDEMVRESVVRSDPDEAYQALLDYREKAACVTTETINVAVRGKRKKISEVKSEIVAAIKFIIDENRRYWPLTDRQVHYRLLNNPPLRNTSTKTHYRNDKKSYSDTCDLLTRLRLVGEVPMRAIADPTRPSMVWNVHCSPRDFVRDELDGFLKGYRRNLQQSQPLHIEVVAEKMTVESIIEPVCGRYNLPYTIGRGYSSLPARYEIVKRFRDSGKERMLLLILSDHDPEGINIAESLLQSLREDFSEGNIDAVRVGLNLEHIERFGLSENRLEAKVDSSRYPKFVERFGTAVFELEALSPAQLKLILSETIDKAIDTEAFNVELYSEKTDARYLQALRTCLQERTIELLDADILEDGESLCGDDTAIDL